MFKNDLIECLEWLQLTPSLLTMHIQGITFIITRQDKPDILFKFCLKETNSFQHKFSQI